MKPRRVVVSLDELALLRQMRGGAEPDLVAAATLAQLAGTDELAVHLREDRMHIQDRDLRVLRLTLRRGFRVDIAPLPESLKVALEIRPDAVTLVPELPGELRSYGGLDVQTELRRLGWNQPTPRQVAEVIIRIRRRKLPDYRTWGNVGSFFKNPVVTQAAAEVLKQAHPKLVMHAHGAAVKLAAAQLIDLCGWKGHRDGAVSVWRRQPLVLVNLGGASARDFLRLGDTIRRSVAERFQVSLEMEPTIVSANGA